MSNTYGISKQDEREIRERDRSCVYCNTAMTQTGASGATIEHFNNDGPLNEKFNVAICCRCCNSSKGTMTLLAWFETAYCRDNKINKETVANPVKEYMRSQRLS